MPTPFRMLTDQQGMTLLDLIAVVLQIAAAAALFISAIGKYDLAWYYAVILGLLGFFVIGPILYLFILCPLFVFLNEGRDQGRGGK